MSRALAVSLLVFLALASTVLVWDGLSAAVSRGHAIAGRELWLARLRLMVGVVVFAIVLWIASGLISRTW